MNEEFRITKYECKNGRIRSEVSHSVFLTITKDSNEKAKARNRWGSRIMHEVSIFADLTLFHTLHCKDIACIMILNSDCYGETKKRLWRRVLRNSLKLEKNVRIYS